MSFAQQLEVVRLDARKFHRAIVWRDAREVLAALCVAGVFIWVARSAPLLVGLAAYLEAAASLGVGLFMLLDRRRHRRSLEHFPGTPVGELRRALAEVDHQIALLRRVAWWYLLPLSLPVVLFGVAVGLESPAPWYVMAIVMTLFTLVLDVAIWALNQWAVRKDLLPRRAALLNRLREWEEEPASAL